MIANDHKNPDLFRRYAKECIDIAGRIELFQDQCALLAMAMDWMLLADQGHTRRRSRKV